LPDAASDAPISRDEPRTTLTASTASLDPIDGKFDQDQTSTYNVMTRAT
jgi:hypothetical protein